MSLMDEVERRRFLNTLRSDDEFRATVRRELLTQELLNLPHTVSALVDAVAEQGRSITDLRRVIAGLADVVAGQTQTLAEHGQTLAEHGQTLAEHGETLADHGQTLAALVDAVAAQRRDFVALAADVRGYMERTITLIGEGFTAVDAKISDLRSDIDAKISDLRSEMTQGFTAVDARFEQVEGELAVIRDRLAS